MNENKRGVQAVVIGGGFYGCSIAIRLTRYFTNVLLIERAPELLTRASLVNQARVHNGYHYPRNLITAYRSFTNFPKFVKDYKPCIRDDFTKIYAIAKNNSKVNAYQFMEMFKGIGAPIERAPETYSKLFNKDLIEEVFLVQEVAFDASILRDMMTYELRRAGVKVRFQTEVTKIESLNGDRVRLELLDGEHVIADAVYNCTYSQINKLMRSSDFPLLPFKHEVTEMALIEMPEVLQRVGVTVMDGPFFSTMPFPSRDLHSLSHVRYTPHFSWTDHEQFIDGNTYLNSLDKRSNYPYMIRDVQRYMPAMQEARYVDSIYEIKTILTQNEQDDGRPILCREDFGIKNLTSIMGGKIDNIYDMIEKIDLKWNGSHTQVAMAKTAASDERN